MAGNNYGIIRNADVIPSNSVEIFYSFVSDRTTQAATLNKLDASELLTTIPNPNNSNGSEILGGLYNLKLPTSIFNQKGIYTIFIKPKEIRTTIKDIGVLSSDSTVKGIVLDYSTILDEYPEIVDDLENNGLIGYRIEYLDTDNPNIKVNNISKIITSNNFCEAITQNVTNSNQKALRYRFNDNASLIFLTLTSSSASAVKPNVFPYMGQANQNIILSNTYFNPVMLEIEMVENDLDTIALDVLGTSTESISDGQYTLYDNDGNIRKQFNVGVIQNEFGVDVYKWRKAKTTIDYSKNLDEIGL